MHRRLLPDAFITKYHIHSFANYREIQKVTFSSCPLVLMKLSSTQTDDQIALYYLTVLFQCPLHNTEHAFHNIADLMLRVFAD